MTYNKEKNFKHEKALLFNKSTEPDEASTSFKIRAVQKRNTDVEYV